MFFIDAHLHLLQSFSCRERRSCQICFYSRNESQNLEFLQNTPVLGERLVSLYGCVVHPRMLQVLELLWTCLGIVLHRYFLKRSSRHSWPHLLVCLFVLILCFFFVVLRLDPCECLLDTKPISLFSWCGWMVSLHNRLPALPSTRHMDCK